MVIEVKNLTYAYPINHLVFEDLNFQIGEGEFWGILGKNGAGKTTLIDLMLGIKYPTKGKISILGEDPNSDRSEHQNDVAFLSQDIKLHGGLSVGEFLNFHSFFFQKYSFQKEAELLEYFNLSKKSLIGALSTGQQKKVQIVAGLASDTKIILIDEITAVLDPETRYRFFEKILQYNRDYKKTVILATNIAEDLKDRANHILYIRDFKMEILKSSDIDHIFKVKS